MDFRRVLANDIKKLEKKNPVQHKELVAELADLSYAAINYNYFPEFKFGWYKDLARLFDKASINRYQLKDGYRFKLRECEDKKVLDFLKGQIKKISKRKLKTNAPTHVVLVYYILYSMGCEITKIPIKAFEDNIKEIEWWMKRFPIGWLITKPNGFFVRDLLGMDYLGLTFEEFMNLSKYELQKLLTERSFKTLRMDFKLCLCLEVSLYANHNLSLLERYF